MLRILSVFMLSICLAVSARAQTLVDFSRNGTLSASQINERAARTFGAETLPRATQSVELFKVRYRSRDERGRAVVLSGLLALPKTAPKGLVIYNHGTMADRAASPSRFRGESQLSEAQLATLAFASGGYAVAMPDYLGLGDHLGAHPYPLGKINARSAIDIVNPARQIIARRGAKVESRLFVTGYSEGGAVSMWTVRVLERENNLSRRVYSSANLSGPYDLSGVTRQSLLSSTNKIEEFVPHLYLLANIAFYQHKANGTKLTKYFKPAMANTVFNAFGRNVSDENIIKRLALTAALMRAQNRLDRVLDAQFLRALQTNDSREPIVRALKQNDTFSWSPRTPQLLVALQGDTIVTSQNTTKTLRTMRARGVGANVVRRIIVRNDKLNHVTFMPQALVIARRFFDGGFVSVNGAQ